MNFNIPILILISMTISISQAGRRSTGGSKTHNRRSHRKIQFPAHIGHKVPYIENNGYGIPYHESVYGYGIRIPDKYPRFNYSALHYRLKHRIGLRHYVKPDSYHRSPYMSNIYGYGVPYRHHSHHSRYVASYDHHKPQSSYNSTAIDVICNDPHKRHSFDRLGIDICKFSHKPRDDNPSNLHNVCNDAHQRKLFDSLGIDICKEFALKHQTPSTGRHSYCNDPNKRDLFDKLRINVCKVAVLPGFDKTDGYKVPLNNKPNPSAILDSYCEDSHHHELFDKHRINICKDYIRPHTDPITVLKSYCENEQQIVLLNKLGINICKDYDHYVLSLFDKSSHNKRGDTLESACKHSHQRELFHKLGITICDELEIPHQTDKPHHKPHHNPGITLNSACKDANQREKFNKLGINICKDFVETPHHEDIHNIPSKPVSFCDPNRRELFDRLRINVCKISGLPGFDKNDGYKAPYRSTIFGYNRRDNAKLYDKAGSFRIAQLVDTTTSTIASTIPSTKTSTTISTTTTHKPIDPCSDEHQRELFNRLGITICN